MVQLRRGDSGGGGDVEWPAAEAAMEDGAAGAAAGGAYQRSERKRASSGPCYRPSKGHEWSGEGTGGEPGMGRGPAGSEVTGGALR